MPSVATSEALGGPDALGPAGRPGPGRAGARSPSALDGGAAGGQTPGCFRAIDRSTWRA